MFDRNLRNKIIWDGEFYWADRLNLPVVLFDAT